MSSPFTVADAHAISAIETTHDLRVTRIERLGSELASTFRIEASGSTYAAKLQSAADGEGAVTRWRSEVMHQLSAHAHPVPALLMTRSGETVGFTDVDGAPISVQVMDWIPATPYGEMPVDMRLGAGLGRAAAAMHLTLQHMPLPPARITHAWDACRVDDVIDQHLSRVQDPEIRRIGSAALDLHARHIAPLREELPVTLVHQDLHDANVLVDAQGEVAAILDFDDMLVGWRVAEPAILAAYLARNLSDPTEAIRDVAAGWSEIVPFTEAEQAVLASLAAVRLALNCVVWSTRTGTDRAAYAHARQRGSARAFTALAASLGTMHDRVTVAVPVGSVSR